MTRTELALALALLLPAPAQALENPLLGYTHMLPSPFTLTAGRFVLGTEADFGVTDFFQVGTGLVSDVLQVYNANVKLNVLDLPEVAACLNLGYENYNLSSFSSFNPDAQISSWQPGATVGYELAPHLAHFVGGHLSLTNVNVNAQGVSTSGYVQGVTGETDLSWNYSSGEHSVGDVLSGGFSYDFTYRIYGIGISHYWPGFHLGVHYYPNASDYKFVPILAGGAAFDL